MTAVRLAPAVVFGLFSGTGCHGYLRTSEHGPLPVVFGQTRDGGQIELRDGNVRLSSPPRDIELLLGAGLRETEEGLVVVQRLRADTVLDPGDHITHVAALVPPLVRDESGAGTAAPPPPDGEAVPAASPSRHPVSGLEDLSRYTCAADWVELELRLVRGGGEVLVRQPLRRAWRRFPVERWDPRQTFRRNGIELCALADWPPSLLPRHAQADDHLVLRVDRDSPAAIAGLRPLDAIANVEAFERTGRARVRRPGGAEVEVAVGARHGAVEVWVPFLFSYERDAMRTHLGVGPLDALFHYSRRLDYSPQADGHIEARKWSLLTVLQHDSSRAPSGESSALSINPFVDPVRLEYLFEWVEDGDDPSIHWGESVSLDEELGAR